MAIDPSDLPRETKRELLDQLRTHLGESQYEELTSRASEDQILRAILRESHSEPAKKESSLPTWVYVIGWVLIVLALLGLGSRVGGRPGWALQGAGWGMLVGGGLVNVGGFAIGAIIGGILGGAIGNGENGVMTGVAIGGLVTALVWWVGAKISRY